MGIKAILLSRRGGCGEKTVCFVSEVQVRGVAEKRKCHENAVIAAVTDISDFRS